jgi:cytochrome c oxidase assembly protein subunit 15
LHVLHRLNGLATAALVAATAAALRRTRPRLALALTGLLAVAVALGVASVSGKPALALVVAHNACAALLVALLARAQSRRAASGAGSPGDVPARRG